jgi:hypothetical protein
MIALIVVVALVLFVVAKAKAKKGRLPALVHDYSDHRAIYQRWPSQRGRRFK